MKTWTPMNVMVVGGVSDVVKGGNWSGHKGGNRPRKPKFPKGPRF